MNRKLTTTMATSLLLMATLLLSMPGFGEEASGKHGFAILGDLKYDKDFTHFDYVNPDAPKGGKLTLHTIGTYDSLNPFILKGHVAANIMILFDSLMAGSGDEIDSYYGLVAESVTMPEDRSWISFKLRESAKWHDGTSITAEDLLFTFDTLKEKGPPSYRALLQGVKRPEVIDSDEIKYEFVDLNNRDLPALVASMPIISKEYYSKQPFDKTSLVQPLGSGPYRIAQIDPGKSITYKRVKDYWGRKLPVNRGFYNFNTIEIDYYRDREVAFEAFKAGEYDIRQEHKAKSWATEYNFPAIKKNQIILKNIVSQQPTGIQATFFNLRRAKFQDRNVRKALVLAFDFEWLNKNIFYSSYERTLSTFELTPMAAHTPITAEELALLKPFEAQIPEEVFNKPYELPIHKGDGRIRSSLIEAIDLLNAAGWHITDKKLTNEKGEVFTIEFLLYEPSLQPIYQPYIKNLQVLGIQAAIRMVDTTQYQNRFKSHDFDMISLRLPQSLSPGMEQKRYWGSSSADLPGSPNVAGIKNPVVDDLVEKLVAAKELDEVITIAKALDRVLMWEYYFIPAWHTDEKHLAYWDKFGMPDQSPPYASLVGNSGSSPVGTAYTWWYDKEKATTLRRSRY